MKNTIGMNHITGKPAKVKCSHGLGLRKCLECRRQYHTLVKTENPQKVLWWNAKSRAKRKGLEFTIRPSDIVIPKVCPLFGIPLDSRDRLHAPSLDRRDSSKGYTPDNVFVISFKANRLKSNATVDQLKALLDYMEHGLGI